MQHQGGIPQDEGLHFLIRQTLLNDWTSIERVPKW